NLILPMLFSFTGLGAFSIAYNLVAVRRLREVVSEGTGRLRSASPYLAGLVAVALIVLLGNLGEVGLLFDSWQRTSDSTVSTGLAPLDMLVRTVDGALDVLIAGRTPPIGTGDWFWTATRAINIEPGETAPITEFPFFTFLYGDLHAHMISLPLSLLA